MGFAQAKIMGTSLGCGRGTGANVGASRWCIPGHRPRVLPLAVGFSLNSFSLRHPWRHPQRRCRTRCSCAVQEEVDTEGDGGGPGPGAHRGRREDWVQGRGHGRGQASELQDVSVRHLVCSIVVHEADARIRS